MRAWTWAAVMLAAASAPVGAQTNVVAAPPRLAAYLDTASLRAALARLPASPAEKRTERLFRVEFDSLGQPGAPRAAVPRAMPGSYRDAVLPLLQASLRPIQPRLNGWVATILLEAGDPPRIEEVFPAAQPPRMLNLGAVHASLYPSVQQAFQADSTLAGRTVTVSVEMMVDEEGRASSPRIVRSSGLEAMDAAALRVVRIIRFRPGTLDGEPFPVLSVQPFRIVFAADG